VWTRTHVVDERPTIDQLRERWDIEWAAVDAWLPTVTDDFVGYVHEGVPVWQMLVHVVNHGTQHRAEAAALLTAEGRSPGELDLINYAENRQRAAARDRRRRLDAPPIRVTRERAILVHLEPSSHKTEATAPRGASDAECRWASGRADLVQIRPSLLPPVERDASLVA
jgi:DinB family